MSLSQSKKEKEIVEKENNDLTRLCTVLGIITGVFGIVTMIEYAVRSFKLMHRNHTFRPLNGKRWHVRIVPLLPTFNVPL